MLKRSRVNKAVPICAAYLTISFIAGCQSVPLNEAVADRWNALLREGGCLTGGQDWRPTGISEGSVLHASAWQEFLVRPLDPTVRFLLGRLDSTEATGVHVCPHQVATEGELALYVLQLRLSANWVDMPSGNPVVKEAKLLHRTHRQKAAQMILTDRAVRNELRDFFFAKSGLTMNEADQLERYRIELQPDTNIALWPSVRN